MRKLPKPILEDIEKDFKSCISNSKKRLEVEAVLPEILNQVKAYDKICSEENQYKLQQLPLSDEIKKMLYSLYDNNFCAKTSKGRELYDKIIASSNVCPYCNCGIVHTIDHYLPRNIQNGYPELSIISLNLVPCCRDCNSTKKDELGEYTKLYLHPYYDNVSAERWLFAKITYINKDPIIEYFVKNVSSYSEDLNKRIAFHFEKLEINKIYSINSISELNTTINLIRNLKISETTMRIYLKELAEMNARLDKNSRQTAMFYALLDDQSFYTNCIEIN